jgi:23S rRNA (uracil747-C5)-methyltransferase
MHCAHYDANRCRSCSSLPLPYPDQLAAKQAHAHRLLGEAQWLEPVASRESGFRNRAKMAVGGSARQPLLGILDAHGHGVDLADCALYPPALQAAFAPLKTFIARAAIEPYDLSTRRGELKYVLVALAEHSGELMVRFVLRSQEPLARMRKHLDSLREALPALRVVSANLQPEHKAVLEGEHEILLTAAATLAMRMNGLTLHLRPQGFFQTHTAMAATLYAQVAAWARELQPAAIWDMYCGVGGFALHCADGGREVLGVEASPEAIAAAEYSRDDAGLARVRFHTADAAVFASSQAQAPELVIVNPPRRGIGETLCHWLDASTARWLIYSSCNAESLARDMAMMPGLRLQRARVFDMFPHTLHYEVLTLLGRD